MSNPADRLNRVVASVPATATAGRVMAKGEHWTPRKGPAGGGWQDTPVPMLPLPQSVPESLIGSKFGRLTVLGYGGKGHHTSRWAVRCDCGAYGYQRAKMLRSSHLVPMCPTCTYADDVKHGRVFYDIHEKRLRHISAAKDDAA